MRNRWNQTHANVSPAFILRYAAARDKVILSAEGDACAERQHKHATSKARIRR